MCRRVLVWLPNPSALSTMYVCALATEEVGKTEKRDRKKRSEREEREDKA